MNNISNTCFSWINANVQWKNGNWTWSECELVYYICSVWGAENSTWKNGNWWWSMCYESGSISPTPPITSNVVIQPPGVDANTLIQSWLEEPWQPYRAGEIEKKKRLVKLICKVKNETFEESKYLNENIKISTDDIKLVVKKVLNIDLDVKYENIRNI